MWWFGGRGRVGGWVERQGSHLNVVAFICTGRQTLDQTRPTTILGLARSARGHSPTPWDFEQAHLGRAAQEHGCKRKRRLRRPRRRRRQRRSSRKLGAHRPSSNRILKVTHQLVIHVRRAQSHRKCLGVHRPTKCGHPGGQRQHSSTKAVEVLPVSGIPKKSAESGLGESGSKVAGAHGIKSGGSELQLRLLDLMLRHECVHYLDCIYFFPDAEVSGKGEKVEGVVSSEPRRSGSRWASYKWISRWRKKWRMPKAKIQDRDSPTPSEMREKVWPRQCPSWQRCISRFAPHFGG